MANKCEGKCEFIGRTQIMSVTGNIVGKSDVFELLKEVMEDLSEE